MILFISGMFVGMVLTLLGGMWIAQEERVAEVERQVDLEEVER